MTAGSHDALRLHAPVVRTSIDAALTEADATFRRADDLDVQLAHLEPIASIDDLEISGVTHEEADAFWSALRSGR